jgi:diguanylate cyclase (GGDEF)-like protein
MILTSWKATSDMKSLKITIFFFFVVLLLAVQSVFVRIIYSAIQQQEENQVRYQLETAQTIFETEFKTRQEYLAAFADTAAKDFALKQAFQEEMRSFLVALNNHRARIDADFAVSITSDGTVSAELISQADKDGNSSVQAGSERGQQFRYPDWLEMQNESHVYELDGSYYQLSLAPLTSGTLTIGWIGFGYNIDQRLAAYYADITGLTTDFVVIHNGVTTLAASSKGALGADANLSENFLLTEILQGTQDENIMATVLELGETAGQQLITVMYGDRKSLIAEIRSQGWSLFLLAALTLSLSLGGAFFIATRISRPAQVLARLAKQIAGGNYDLAFDINTGGELGELAAEIKHMQQAVISREQLISHHAYHDDLTGLPNRNRLLQVLHNWTLENGNCFSTIKLCIQRINEINCSLGHDIGDKVIQTVADHIRQMTSGEVLFHLGGSEFVLLYRHTQDIDLAEDLDTLLETIEPEFQYQGISLYIELQVGAVIFPLHAREASTLLQKASVAMHHAQKVDTSFQLYNAVLTSDNLKYLQLINDLKNAIDAGQLALHYQPKLSLGLDEIHHVEALVRWSHPQQGMIPPDHFIAIAEQTGLINDLTRWVLQEAARQFQRWAAIGIRLSIAVNVSYRNLQHKHFYDLVMSILEKTGMPHEALSLEMTERAVVDDMDAVIAVLSRFRDAGIRISIDDFGTGYSSLTQLKNLPVSELKIDKSFVLNLLDEQANQVIVRSSIELAHNLGMFVVAEGVEDEATLRWLRRNGCDIVQGYHISRPQPAEKLQQWLLEEARHQQPTLLAS